MKKFDVTKYGRLLLVLAVVAVLGLGVYRVAFGGSDRLIKKNKYQAIFLTNGQVYFGHLSGIDSPYPKIKDIYYLQVQQNLQQEDKDKQQADANATNVSLAKLGTELHGPEDTMYVAKDQILFWENLKDDGKVVTAIKDYKKTKE